MYFRILSEFNFSEIQKCTFIFCLHCWILHVYHLGLILSVLSSLVIGKMDDKQDRLRHSRVSQHASVRRKKARPSRPLLGVSSLEAKMSISGVQMSLALSSRRQVWQPSAPKTFSFHVEAPIIDVVVYEIVPEVFRGYPYNTSLLHMHTNHVVKHMWDIELKYILSIIWNKCVIIFELSNNYFF